MSPSKFTNRISAALAGAGASAIILAGVLAFTTLPFAVAAATDVPAKRLSAAGQPVAKIDPASAVVVAVRPLPKKATATNLAIRTQKTSGKVVPVAWRPTWRSARASWYGPGFYGNTMAGGGRLTRTSMVVAHRTLPFGTRVLITYRGKSAIAEVRDRGPYIRSRQFDLGPGTAKRLGFRGVGTIRYRILGRG